MGTLYPIWDICRGCGCKEDDMQSIFNRENGENLVAIFEKMLGIRISRYDKLPDKICQNCLGGLRAWNEFNQMYYRSYMHFMEYLPVANNDNLFHE